MAKQKIFEHEDAPAIATRLWNKVTKTDTCWLWRGAHTPFGYGVMVIRGKNKTAHRVAYALEHGIDALDPNLMLCHRCDRPACVRPSHLFQGTQKENQADSIAKGRSARGNMFPNAKLNPEAVRYIRRVAIDNAGIGHCVAKFDVSGAAIIAVVKRTSWKHVPD